MKEGGGDYEEENLTQEGYSKFYYHLLRHTKNQLGSVRL